MPDAYVFVEMKITDPERYREYMAEAPTSVAAHGGQYVVRGGPHQVLEGTWQPSRIGILRFPSVEQAKAWYDSEQYRRTRDRRAGATEYFHMVVVEGVGAPV